LTYNDLEIDAGEITAIDDSLQAIKSNAFYYHYYAVQSRISQLLLRSHVGRFLIYLLQYRKPNIQGKDAFYETVHYQLDEQRTSQVFQEFNELAHQHNFSLQAIVLPVARETPQMKILRQVMRAQNVVYTDLNNYCNTRMSPEEKKNLFFPRDPCHFTVSGHAVVAEMLYEAINLFKREAQ